MNPLATRRAGILLHLTSLPGGGLCGSLGSEAYRFVDFLVAAGQSVWQFLPVGPTHDDGSPYQCLSLHAGNPLYIGAEQLISAGWLDGEPKLPKTPSQQGKLLDRAYRGFVQRADDADRHHLSSFVAANHHWLEDYALYVVLREAHGHVSWVEWPAALRDRDAAALQAARLQYKDALERVRFEQFVFYRQWQALKEHANRQGILLFGDLPIFVAHDSADVWAQQDYFQLDDSGRPIVVAGVPPDYFSATGQRWGNPHYRWERMQQDGFQWWVVRFKTQFQLFDLVRIDHFRGFESYWEIPAGHDTAMGGRWMPAPGDALFETLHRHFDPLPVVAEDLGLITPEVEAMRLRHGFPGMKILQFAFDGGPANAYLPHNHHHLAVVYTGTHDNDTTVGWYSALPIESRRRVDEYLHSAGEPMPWPMIRAALASVATLAVVPLQDVMALGGEHRMNTPGKPDGNWRWRFTWDQVSGATAPHLRHLTEMYGRLPPRP
jgi:4-alpha-glucanotransferase